MKKTYYYPQHLTEEVRFGFWVLRDLALLAVLAGLGVLALLKGGTNWLLVLAAVFAFLTVRTENDCLGALFLRLARFVLGVKEYRREETRC